MKILWMIRSLNPEDGGPVTALRQDAIALQELGEPSEILTLDSENAPWISEFPGIVHALGPSLGKYAFNLRALSWLQKNANEFNAIIVSGIWGFPGLAARLISQKTKIPYYIFTHGTLDPWFKVAYPLKHLKKSFYWFLIGHGVLQNANAVFFTSHDEKQLASDSFPMNKIKEVVIDRGLGSPEGDREFQRDAFLKEYPTLREKKLFLFLSRIHIKKGCDLLIEAFSHVSLEDSKLHLIMAGPDEEGWASQLKQRCSQLGIEDRVTWTGMLSGDIKWGAFYASDVLILPSHSENFGVVIAEALSRGVPVLTTHKVNIWRDILQDGAGIIEPDTIDGIIRLMHRWYQMSTKEQQMMRINAVNCFHKRYDIKITTRKFLDTLESCM